MQAGTEEINGRLLRALLDYASFRLGPDAARRAFADAAERFGTPLDEAIDPRSWASLELFHGVVDAYRPLLGERFVRDAVTWIVPVRRELSAASITALTGPSFFYRHLDRARSFFARHVSFTMDVGEHGEAEAVLRYREGVPRRHDSCDVARGVLSAVPLLFELPAAEITETRCFAAGADACAFKVKWRDAPPLARTGFLVGLVGAVLGATAWPSVAWAALPLVGLAVGREARMTRVRRLMARVTEEQRRVLEENERDFERRFREIRELNDKLEKRVAERTAQIHGAMEELRERNAAMRETIEEMNRLHAGVIDAGVRGILGQAVQEFAHEMKNPMSYVLANLDFLESATVSQADDRVQLAELAEVVRDARLGVDRMRAVLAWFMELNEGDRDVVTPYHVNDEIKRTIGFYTREWEGRIRVHLDLEEVPPIQARGKQLNQVLVNLVTNASQAMRRGNLWISTRRDGDRVVIAIKDDGPGIAPDQLPHIFERGHTTRPGVGSGLGLYISRAIVDRHHGTIDAKSAPGKGAELVVSIPARGVTGT